MGGFWCGMRILTTPTREFLDSRLVVFAGMPRTGSTSLFHILGQHPGIFRPFRKEVGYFLFNHHKGERWYRHAYAGAAPAQRCVDVTPEYFFSPRAAERMHAFGENVRVVIGIRDPASFVTSLYSEYGKRYAVPSLERFFTGHSYRRGSERIEFSFAAGTIRTMLDLYGRMFGNRVLFYDFASFARDPVSILQSLETFIGLKPHFTSEAYRPVHLNRADRRNTRWLSAILSVEPLIDLASRVVPAATLRRVAALLYSGGTACASSGSAATIPEWLDESVAADREAIRKLLGAYPVVDGLGRAFQRDA